MTNERVTPEAEAAHREPEPRTETIDRAIRLWWNDTMRKSWREDLEETASRDAVLHELRDVILREIEREAAHREPESGTCWFCRREVPWATLIAGYDTWDEQRLACATCDRPVRWLRDHGWNLSRAANEADAQALFDSTKAAFAAQPAPVVAPDRDGEVATGIDLASGEDRTAWRCSNCGATGWLDAGLRAAPSASGDSLDTLAATIHRALTEDDLLPNCGGTHFMGYAYCQRLAARLAPSSGDSLDVAWQEAEAALGPQERLVLWQDKGGPQWVQVLAPEPPTCEHESEDTMRPKISTLAAYPRKGLGDLPAALHALAARLRATEPAGEPEG